MIDAVFHPADQIRETLLRADRLRRAREARRVVAAWAPRASVVVLLLAIVSRWQGGVALVPLVAAVLGGGWLLLVVLQARRVSVLDDGLAHRLDDASGLGGELRSAWWFTTREPDAWQRFHLEQAADRLRRVVWSDVFPSVPVRLPVLVSAGLVVAAVVAAWPLQSWRLPGSPVAPVAAALPEAEPVESLPPDLRQQILDVLAAMSRGELSSEDALMSLSRSSDWAALPSALREKLTEQLRRVTLAGEVAAGRPAPAPPGATSDQAEWAKDDLAAREANEQAQKNDRDENVKSVLDGKPEKDGGVQTSASGAQGEASDVKASSVQRVPPSGQAGSSAAVMLEQKDAASGEAGSGLGGKRSDSPQTSAETAALEAALHRELVRADTNGDGADKSADDRRRNTERRASSQQFSRAAERATFDRSRADATNTVPESRLSWLERYFVRSEGSR